VQKKIDALVQVLQALPGHLPVLEEAAGAIVAALRAGNKVLTCGNGGSAAEAMHLTTELVGRYDKHRVSLPSVFLGGDASLMSCVANDYGFDEVFARPLEGHSRPGDVLVLFSTSGNAANLRRVLEVARSREVRSLALLGKSGGCCRGLATWEVLIDSPETARIQEAQAFLVHWLCDRIEEAFVS